MTSFCPGPLSKGKKNIFDNSFNYVPPERLNPNFSNKEVVKHNENHKRVLNYFSFEQSINDNIENTASKGHIDFESKLLNIRPKERQFSNLMPLNTENNFRLSTNIKLKLSASKDIKCPMLFKPSTKNIKNSNAINYLFSNFLTKVKDSYPLLYPEFYSYCLSSSLNPNIGVSEKETTQLFKSLCGKFQSKNPLKNDDLAVNTLFLSTIECLLMDYNKFISKTRSSFFQAFFECYKEVVVINYGIFNNQVIEKTVGVKQQEEDIKSLKAKINELNSTFFDIENRTNLLNLDNEKYQAIVTSQREEIKGLKDEIEQLKNTIQIKNYEIHELRKKNEDHLKDNLVSGLNSKTNEYDEKLDIDKLLKNRLERVKFNIFKKDVFTKKRKETIEEPYYVISNPIMSENQSDLEEDI